MDDPCLLGDDLLRPQRQPRRVLGRERQGLVERIGVQALGPAQDAGQCLNRHPYQIDLGLLAVRDTPAVCVWKRSWQERPSAAP